MESVDDKLRRGEFGMMSRDRFGLLRLTLLIVVVFMFSGCGSLFGSDNSEATPEASERVLVPTFTPTPVTADAAQAPAANTVEPPVEQPEEAPPAATPIPPEEPTQEPAPEPPTATPVPKVIVNIDAANVRNGPGTNYGLAGSVTRGQTFDIKGKNADGTWWQFCCVNGQDGWIFDDLVLTENANEVAVAENIPAPPPVAVAPPAPAPVEPPKEEEPPPPAQADPCPKLDGCTFRLTGGPTASENGGGELKLQLAFVHGGRGNEAQGSYFVGVNKDGVKLPIKDDVRSWTGEKRQGIGGLYNYEYKLGLDDLPGRSVAGGYEIWAIDGNGNQASPSFPFSVGGSQGEIWIEFNQG